MTLRNAVIAISAGLLAIALFCFVTGATAPGMISLILWPAFILAAVLFERRRYKAPLDEPPGEGWEATAETFIDPGSGEALRVYFNPATGKRAYVRVERPKTAG
jgi:hypothetical protein